MVGWLKKQSAAGACGDRPSYQMRSDQRFIAAIDFFTGVQQIVIERKEWLVRDGLQAEFEALRHSGLAFILANSQLRLARSAAHIPRLLMKIDNTATSFVAVCDRLAFFAKNQDVTYMMDGLKRATVHVVATAEAEYRPRSTQAYCPDV
jgi:DNA invertase Pin-like site-specific DNA recombinase